MPRRIALAPEPAVSLARRIGDRLLRVGSRADRLKGRPQSVNDLRPLRLDRIDLDVGGEFLGLLERWELPECLFRERLVDHSW